MEYVIACLGFVAVFAMSQGASAGEVPSHTIYRAGTPVTIDGRLDEPAWVGAPDFGAFVFPWWKEGKKEQTVAKMLWDDEYLYVAYVCEDAHIWAEHTARRSEVYEDDCVEVFVAPNPDRPLAYFNIEMNVLGIFLDWFQPEGPDGQRSREWKGQGIRIATSIVGTLNDDGDLDDYWILEVGIPFHNFSGVAVHTPPKPGDVWHLNLNRLGGRTNAQFSQWSASRTEEPQFHSPADFGRVTFSDLASPFWQK